MKSRKEILHHLKYLPHSKHMAHGTYEHEDVEYRMYIRYLMQAVKHRTYDISYALTHDEQEHEKRNSLVELFHCHNHGKPHKHIAERLNAVMLFHRVYAHECAYYGKQPTEDEDTPSPVSHITHGDERYGRIATGNVPIDCRVVELAQDKSRGSSGLCRMVCRRTDERTEHTHKVKDNTCYAPGVTTLRYHVIQKVCTNCHGTNNTYGMCNDIHFLLFGSVYFVLVTHKTDINFANLIKRIQ